VTAQVGVYDRAERITTLYPARDYHGRRPDDDRGLDQVRIAEDVYLVLTARTPVSAGELPACSSIRSILWVWIGS
jgi:hypothetical protein